MELLIVHAGRVLFDVFGSSDTCTTMVVSYDYPLHVDQDFIEILDQNLLMHHIPIEITLWITVKITTAMLASQHTHCHPRSQVSADKRHSSLKEVWIFFLLMWLLLNKEASKFTTLLYMCVAL